MSGHKFKVGQLLNYRSREQALGVYQITQLLPSEGATFLGRYSPTQGPLREWAAMYVRVSTDKQTIENQLR
jgi:hypothetical protein